MSYLRCCVPFLVLLFIAAARVSAAENPPAEFTAARAPHPLSLDPALTDPAWATGAVPAPAYYFNLTRNERARDVTQAHLLYDDENLYVGFRCAQAGPIVATQTTNDIGLGLDDFVGIALDTSGNGSQVYAFETTPRGVRYQQASESERYRPRWSANGRVAEGAWSAVLIIPLAALRFSTKPSVWRVNFVRSTALPSERYTWAYNGLMQDAATGAQWPPFSDARFWPRLTSVNVSAKRTAHVPAADIYGLASTGPGRNTYVLPDGSVVPQRARNVGLDLTYPITSTTSFVGALNPDFSNIEVDQQTIAPQEFLRQLVEYRPFFAQGAAFIEANPYPPGGVAASDLVFYTPNIGPFDRGAKVEGTSGNSSFGAMSFRGYDATAKSTFDDIAYGFKNALQDRTFQYWADGVLAHHSGAGHDTTTEFGVGGRNNRTGFVWQADDSLETGTELADHSDHSLNAFVDIHKPNYELNLAYRDVGPYYAPLDGYTALADLRGPSASLNFFGSPRGPKNAALNLYADRYTDRSGAVHEADTFMYLAATLKNGFSIDQFGPSTGVLRSYAVPSGPNCTGAGIATTSYSGAPCYRNGATQRFNLFRAQFGYLEGTSSPVTLSFAAGPFGSIYLHQFMSSASRSIGTRYSLGLEYDGTYQRSQLDGSLGSQWLRRISFGVALGADQNLALSLRTINGSGGYALPGSNFAASFHRRYRNGNDLYIDIGTPTATSTLNRLLLKYVFHTGTSTT